MFKAKAILLGGVAAAAISSAAFSADVPVRGPVYTKAPAAWSWEGQYIGVHGGYFWGDNVNSLAGPAPFNVQSGYGGVQVGYLHHLNRNWLVGYEADVSFGNINDTVGGVTHNVNVFGTARTRLGYAQGQWLFYATGGLAWARTNFETAGVDFRRAQVGYAVGAGIEYAFAPNWSARVEYLYMDLGDTTTTGFPLVTDLTASTVRLGLNYRFANWNAPRAAAYPVKAPVRVSGWTGPYIGIHGGYASGDFDTTNVAAFSADPKGGLFGIQSGYNWQFASNWVVGVEGDTSWASIRDTASAVVDIDQLGTVRARLGYASGNVLFYATGGLAWMHADTTSGAVFRDQFYLGWAAGAGIEYAFSSRWSAKFEYTYSDFSSRDIAAVLGNDEFNLHTIKFGLNYRAGILDLLAGRI